MSTLTPTALSARVATAEAELTEAAPGLLAGFREALPGATRVVAGRLLSAGSRENLAGLDATTAVRHGFGRVEPVAADDPALLFDELTGRLGHADLTAELADAVTHLALAYARRERHDVLLRQRAAARGATDLVALIERSAPDEQAVFFEQLATEGHNLHPCGRTRLGWGIADALAHDLEAGATTIDFVGIRRDLHVGDDLGALLGVDGPRGYVVQPVHSWQLTRVVAHRYADLFASRALVLGDHGRLSGTPTAALRTLLLSRPAGGHYLKLSLDIQVTSTRRTLSVASTRNGPTISALLHRLVDDDPAGSRLLLMDEVAGAGHAANRDLGAILRRGLHGRLVPGEVAVPAAALSAVSPLTGRTVLGELVARYGRVRRLAQWPAALAFLDEYVRLLLPPVLRLATRYGVALEAHLQNCVPTFVDGVPHRLALRDFAGLRLHLPRLATQGLSVPLWPGSVVGTVDVDVMRAKLAYTTMQAHLGELVLRLVQSHGLDEWVAWHAVRTVVDEVYDELRADPRLAADASADHAFLTAPTVPHKALVRMRLRGGSGDLYVPVGNPLR